MQSLLPFLILTEHVLNLITNSDIPINLQGTDSMLGTGMMKKWLLSTGRSSNFPTFNDIYINKTSMASEA